MEEGLNVLKKNKRGEAENLVLPKIIFITLNIMFAVVLLAFVVRASSGAVIYEQTYAKQIALIIEESEPVMVVKLNMEEGMEIAEEKVAFEEIVSVKDNRVVVKLSEKGGYGYSFFNDVEVHAYPDKDDNNEYTGEYVITINERTT